MAIPPGENTTLFWPLNPVKLLGAVIGLPWLGKEFFSKAFMRFFFNQKARLILSKYPETRTEVLTQFDDRFDLFWARMVSQTERLMAVRDKRALNWHFKDYIDSGKLRVVVAYDSEGAIQGYAALVQDTGQGSYLLDVLMQRSLQLAFQENIDILEAHGFSQNTRLFLQRWKPLKRKLKIWPFYYKTARGSNLNISTQSIEQWDPCLYDGDGLL